MLTFILLVVVGGGLGLWVVSSAEKSKPATEGGSDRRGDTAADDAPTPPEPEPEPEPEPAPVPAPRPAPATTAAFAESRPPVRRRAPDPRTVPKAFTAVEGRYVDVARAPWWRRLFSLVALAVIAVAVAVAVAAIVGAVVGAAAEILGNAIG